MRTTGPLLKVLQALLDENGPIYGLELLRRTSLKSGTLYPLLDRLEGAGWVTSQWEDTDPVMEMRPRRRFYRLTGEGAHNTRQLLLEYGMNTPAVRPLPAVVAL
jgi:PadR family transcriptional regulator, regulatory protein PadR